VKAKPEIDLLIVVKSTGNIDAINFVMTELDYEVRVVGKTFEKCAASLDLLLRVMR